MQTKKNGTATWNSAAAEWDFTLSGSTYANRNPLRPLVASRPYSHKPAAGYVYGAHGLTAVVRVFGRDGLLNTTHNVSLPSADASVAIKLNLGQVVIVALS